MSGLLAGFLGGIAKGGLDIINTEEAQQRKIEDEDRREEATMRAEERRALAEQKRQETLQILAEQREEKRRQRDAGDMIGASEDAEKAVSDRGFEKFKSDLGQTDASPEELRKVYESQYHDKTVGGFQGADRYDVKESEKAKERLNQLQRRGASSGLISSAFNDVKTEQGAERDAANRAFNERKLAEQTALQEARLAESARKADLQHSATLASINARGSRDNDSPEKIKNMTSMDIDRAITAARTSVALELGVPDADVPQQVARLKKNAATNPQAAERLAALQPALERWDALRQRQMDLDRNLPEDKRKPTPSASPVKQNDGQSSKRNPPAIASIKGAPSGSSIGSYVDGKGWEVRANGKLVGYAKDKD